MLNFLKINTTGYISNIFLFLLFLSIFILFIKNKKLKTELEELKLENNTRYSNSNDENDIVSLSKISTAPKIENNSSKKEKAFENNPPKEKKDSNISKFTSSTSTKKNIHQNVRKEKEATTSQELEMLKNIKPICEEQHQSLNSAFQSNKKGVTDSMEPSLPNRHLSQPSKSPKKITTSNFNLDEFIHKDEKNLPKPSSQQKKHSVNYLEEVSNEILKTLKPQTIELTDYEQNQEDNAIISYRELLKQKDGCNPQEDETIDFLEELKKFRNSLN